MTYHNAVKFIKNSPSVIPKECSVSDRIAMLCGALGNPHKKIKYIRLAGTNGKTVCARMLISILNDAGIVNGCLSMPVYDEVRDNIRIAGEPVSMEEMTGYVEQLCRAVATINSTPSEDGSVFTPTVNEIMLCIALLAFVDHNCELCIIEGDHYSQSTSRFLHPPLATVICGRIPDSEPEEINQMRSYICKGVREIISAPQDENAYKVISDTCVSASCRLTVPARSRFEIKKMTLRGTDFRYEDHDYSLRICGKFQTTNAMVAIETAEMLMRCGYDISRENIQNGLSVVQAPGKFEVISLSPTIIADSTHSAVAIGTVCDSLAEFKDMVGTRIRLCLPEGDLVSMFVDSLCERGYSIEKISVLTSVATEEKSNAETEVPTVRFNTAKLAAKDALEGLDSECTLLITGPVNFTRAIRHALLGILGF